MSEVTVIAAEPDDRAAIRLALEYPYARHPVHYWFEDGNVGTPADIEAARHRRLPVVAYGSNASPLQIARKFAGRPCGDALFVEPVTLKDWDVIYAARITRYGAIPARLDRAEGCSAAVHVTWLTDAQLKWMDQTEGTHYRRAKLGAAEVVDSRGNAVKQAHAYLRGGAPLLVDGAPAALAAISTSGRRLAGHHTHGLLAKLARVASHAGAVETFVLRLVRDPEFAAGMQPLLRRGL